MKKILIFITALLLPAGVYAANYTVSGKSLNSITCPDQKAVTDIFASEKALIKFEARNDKVFFEFIAVQIQTAEGYSHIRYADESTTLAVFCGDDEYILNLTPAERSSGVHIKLPSRVSNLEAVLSGLKREEQISSLVRMVLTGELKGMRTTNENSAQISGGKEFYLRKIHKTGSYIVKEIYCYTENGVSEDEILSLSFVRNPAAVTLPDVTKGWLRILVIEDSR